MVATHSMAEWVSAVQHTVTQLRSWSFLQGSKRSVSQLVAPEIFLADSCALARQSMSCGHLEVWTVDKERGTCDPCQTTDVLTRGTQHERELPSTIFACCTTESITCQHDHRPINSGKTSPPRAAKSAATSLSPKEQPPSIPTSSPECYPCRRVPILSGPCFSSHSSLTIFLTLCILLTSSPFHATISCVTGCYVFPPGKTNPCTNQRCLYGAECMPSQDGKTARCQCPSECPNYGDSQGGGPVCGSNGIDYPNMCELRKESCTSMKNIRVKYYGKCGKRNASLAIINFSLYPFFFQTGSQTFIISCMRKF